MDLSDDPNDESAFIQEASPQEQQDLEAVDEDEALAQQEHELAASQPQDTQFGKVVDFALAMGHVRAGHFDYKHLVHVFESYGLSVPPGRDWIEHMESRNETQFMQGVRMIEDYLERHPGKVDKRKLQDKIKKDTLPSNLEETKKTFGSWSIDATEVDKFFSQTAKKIIHNIAHRPPSKLGKRSGPRQKEPAAKKPKILHKNVVKDIEGFKTPGYNPINRSYVVLK